MKRWLILIWLGSLAWGANLTVGVGKTYSTIGQCITAMSASGGDTCTVYADAAGGSKTYAESPNIKAGTVGNYNILTANPGDTITINGNVTINSHTKIVGFTIKPANFTGACVAIAASATVTDWYVTSNIMSQCGRGVGAAIFEPTNSTISFGYIQGNTISYPCTDNTLVDGKTCAAMDLDGNHQLIENNDISHVSDGITFTGGAYNVYRNNTMHDALESECSTSGNGGNCHIDFISSEPGTGQEPNTYNLYEGNVENTCVGGNCHVFLTQGDYCTGCGWLISRYNAIYNVEAVYLLDDNPGGGGGGFPHVKDYNNTIVKMVAAAGDVYAMLVPNSYGAIKNNIIVDGPNGDYFYLTATTGWVQRNNLAFCRAGCTFTDSQHNGTGIGAAGVGNILNQDPKFKTYPSATPDLHLLAGSPAINAGTSLTTVASTTGSGTSVTLADADYFQDGKGITGVQADWIRIGASTTVQITGVNYTTKVLSLANSVSWTQNDPVYLYKKSDGVVVLNNANGDIGAYPYVSVGVPPTITANLTLPGGTVGTPYSATLTTSAGDTPITWSIASGTLPAGVTLTGATGVIAGTPTTAGTSNFTVHAVNAAGPSNPDKALSIVIALAPPVLQLPVVSHDFLGIPVAGNSANYSFTVNNTGGSPLIFQTPSLVNSWGLPGDYFISSYSCTNGATVIAGGSCTITVRFTPTAVGSRPGSMILKSNVADATISLAGIGSHFSTIGSGIGTGSTTIGAYTVVTPPSGDFAELPRAYVGFTGQSLSTYGPPGGTYDREEQLGYGTADHPATCAGLTAAYNDWAADGDEWFRVRVLAGSLLQTASACIDLPTKVVAGNPDKRPTKYFVIESSSPATAGQTICSHDFRSDAARNPTCAGDTSHLWTIESTAVSSNPVQLQSVDVNGNGINHIIIRDLEVREQAGLAALDYFLVTVGDSTQTTVASWPHEIGIDRVWAHGDHDDCPGGTCTGSNNVENGFYLESCLDCWVINSQVSRLLWAGHEGHGFSCIECRQVKIVNNWIEGPSIHLFCGGAPVNTQGEQGCTDTEIRKNRLSHPASWLDLAITYPGIGNRYHKNCMEFKTASRVLVEDNICENIDNSGQQSGRLFGFSPRIYNNLDDNYDVTVNNLTIAYNIGRHACNGIQLIGYSGVGGQSGNGNALGATAYTVIQNLIYDISYLNTGCDVNAINGSAVGLLYNEGAFEMNIGLCTATRNSAATQSTITCPGGVSQNQTQVSAGELINVLDCSDTSFNMPTATGNPTGVVPALSPTVRTSLSVTYANPVPGQGGVSTGGCTLQRHGHPRGSYIAHNTFIGDSSVAGKTFAIKDDGTARARAFTQDGTYLDNIWTSNLGIKELNGGPAEGTVSEAMQWDVGSTLFHHNVLVGRNAASYTDYNPRGVPANPSTANYFPTYEYCSTTDPTATSCAGFVGLMNIGAHNFNLSDWHGYRLCAASDAACNHKASVFAAGQAKQASDGKDMGVDFNALDVHLGSTRALCPFVQPPLCTSVGSVITGSFPD